MLLALTAQLERQELLEHKVLQELLVLERRAQLVRLVPLANKARLELLV